MEKQKVYWKGFEQLQNDPAFLEQAAQEMPRDIPTDDIFSDGLSSNRRNFLKFFGFSVSAAVLAACQKTPVKYALPYNDKPWDLTPSIPNYYASTYWDGGDFQHVLVKTREGRPIFIEGFPESPISKGSVSGIGHATVLGLYDSARVQQPIQKDKGLTTWTNVDAAIKQKLDAIKAKGGQIRILTSTLISPSTQRLLAEFAAAYPGTQIVQYDSVPASGLVEAHQNLFGKRAIPTYHFDKAQYIVGINADFLGTWINPSRFAQGYGQARRITDETKSMAKHVQFETTLSLSGANADLRVPMKPSQEGLVVGSLYNFIAQKAGGVALNLPKTDLAGNSIETTANELWAARGKGLVVCGSNDPNVQALVAGINLMLGNYGTTLDINKACNLRQAIDSEVTGLLAAAKAKQIDALFLVNANPVYDHPAGAEWAEAIKNLSLSVAFTDREDESATHAQFLLPTSHYLESWDDFNPFQGVLTLSQPTINKVYDTRQFAESLLVWLGKDQSYYEYIRQTWAQGPLAGGDFETQWQEALHNGGLTQEGSALSSEAAANPATVNIAAMEAAAAAVAQTYGKTSGLEVYLYQKVGIGDGKLANNPWLQEMPDPITKAVWDNYFLVNKVDADSNGWNTGVKAKLTVNGQTLELPVYVLPGQTRGTVSVAVGYGRADSVGFTSKGIGQNAYPLAKSQGANIHWWSVGAELKSTGERYDIATTQMHQTIMDRDLVRETVIGQFAKDISSGNKAKKDFAFENLYSDYKDLKTGHHWGMVVDLTACIGCGACVVACNSENNVSVVGKKEVLRGREMHWMRIDRYFSSSTEDIEKGAEYPDVVFQPLMCQHCDNAPCENVCPVLATVHSDEGLNQMVYNRCIGTRYCANNCPYKVRRFNWFDYTNRENFPYNPGEGDISRLVLNPDVTVRARGVMEKCSFCVQRIQTAKLTAKMEQRPLKDGDIKVACQSSCPTGCIKFGDLNDPNSEVAKAFAGRRSYALLEEVKTKPTVNYLVKVRNRAADAPAAGSEA